jgi:hypothetical protein
MHPAPARSLEELITQMRRTAEAQTLPEEAQSLEEVIPEIPAKRMDYYQPVGDSQAASPFRSSDPVNVREEEISEHPGFEFDIRRAIIASEILNRKYQL